MGLMLARQRGRAPTRRAATIPPKSVKVPLCRTSPKGACQQLLFQQDRPERELRICETTRRNGDPGENKQSAGNRPHVLATVRGVLTALAGNAQRRLSDPQRACPTGQVGHPRYSSTERPALGDRSGSNQSPRKRRG